MEKISCLIVDDEPIAQRIIEGYLTDLPELELAGKCKNALEARQFLANRAIDLLFLDIEMPKLKGLSFLRTIEQPPAVIITTAHREYALEGYDLEVIDYLLKPISFERFLKAVNLYKKRFSIVNTNPKNNHFSFLFVKSNRKTIRLPLESILYIEGMNNYIKIHTGEGVHVVYDSLSRILERLPEYFFRIHKSFIVNNYHIKAFAKEYIEIGDRQLPIGQIFRETVHIRLAP